MDRFSIKPIVTLSNPIFYKKIVQKYQTGKKNISRFPRIIFCKKEGYFFPQKINIVLKFRLHSDKQNVLPSLTVQKIFTLKRMLPELNTEKSTFQSIVKPKGTQVVSNVTNTFLTSFKITQKCQIGSEFLTVHAVDHSILIREENIRKNQYKFPLILQREILVSNSTTLGEKKYFSKLINRVIVNRPLIKSYYGNFSNPASSPILNPESSSLYKKTDWIVVNKHLIKSCYHNLWSELSSSVHRTYAYKIGSKTLHFQDSRNIEQEIEQIKRVVIQTKKSILEKIPPAFGEADIKRHLDINRISDQVYQNLERKIRMERERRGI